MAERNEYTEALDRHTQRIADMTDAIPKHPAPDIGEERVSQAEAAKRFRTGTPEFRRQFIEKHGQQEALKLLGKKKA